MLAERLGHLSQRVNYRQTQKHTRVSPGNHYQEYINKHMIQQKKPDFVCMALTWVSRLAVYALFRGAANGPVLVHKETMTQRVTQPLHGRRDAATGRQTGLPSAAQEHSLQDRKIKSYLHLPYVAHIKIWIQYQTKMKASAIKITALDEKTV